MSYWIYPQPLDDEARAIALQSQTLAVAANGMGDLSRAHGVDQISEWLRALYPTATPEHVASLAQHFWQLGHELLPEDTLIVPTHKGHSYMIGELAGRYRKEKANDLDQHVWPVHWIEIDIPATQLPALSVFTKNTNLTEITHDQVLASLKEYGPGAKKKNISYFRWISIIILIFELIYFWPKN